MEAMPSRAMEADDPHAVVVLVMNVAGAWFSWYKFFREEPAARWITKAPICASSTDRSAASGTPGSRTGSCR